MYGEDFETNEWVNEKKIKLFWMIYFYSKKPKSWGKKCSNKVLENLVKLIYVGQIF